MAKEPKSCTWADAWRWFNHFCVTLVICFFTGWVIALCFNDPITVKQEDGTWRETSSWVGFQRVYVLTHPKCVDEVDDNCVTLTDYADEISAAYQLGRLDYVTVAVSLLAVVLGVAALFGFASIRQKSEVIAERVSKKIAKNSAAKAKAKLKEAQDKVDAAVSAVEKTAEEVAAAAFQQYVADKLKADLKNLVGAAIAQEKLREELKEEGNDLDQEDFEPFDESERGDAKQADPNYSKDD